MEVFSGYLTVRPQSLLKTKSFDNVWCILYSGRGSLVPRLDLHQDKENLSHQTCRKTIYIEEARWRKLDQEEATFSFEVKHSKQYVFICQSQTKLWAWVQHLCCVSTDLFTCRHIIGLDSGRTMVSNGEKFEIQENVLYSVSHNVASYTVIAEDSEGCHEIGLKGLLRLQVEGKMVKLVTYDTGRPVISWSLHELRNFGHSPRTFFIQAGKRCKTGSGKFIFHTTEGEAIVQHLNKQAQRIREQVNLSSTEMPSGMLVTPRQQEIVKDLSSAPQLRAQPLIGSISQKGEVHSYANVKGTGSLAVPGAKAGTSPTEDDKMNKGILQMDIRKTLEETITPDGQHGKRLSVSRSVSSQSADSQDKKTAKEIKKEKKRREEEEKRERKKREEEEKKEKKRREMEAKKQEKEKRKGWQKSSIKKPLQSKEMENAYATPDDCYATADDGPVSIPTPSPKPPLDLEEKIYSEPWKSEFPLAPPASPGLKAGTTAIYADPVKTGKSRQAAIEGREVVHVDNYEPVVTGLSSQPGVVPVTLPKLLVEEDEDADASNNNHLYDHFSHRATKSTGHENIYGMASASAPISLSVHEEENPYEDTSVSNYEPVA